MKRYRYLLYYIITIGFFSVLMYLVLDSGKAISTASISSDQGMSGFSHFRTTVLDNIFKPLPLLLLQVITIIFFARITGFLFRKIGQPTVIGEIVAGILLGPSVLGAVFPSVSGFLFPATSIPALQFLSQIGLILFMFIIGMDVDLKALGKKAPEAFVVSHASIIIPFALGLILALKVYGSLAPEDVPFMSFALFIGISMSITAFPVLARILQERNLLKTKLGAFAITCAAVDDISAWFLLAALIAIVKAGSIMSSLFTISLSVLYLLLMFRLIRPFLRRLGEVFTIREGIRKPVIAIYLVTLFVSSYITEVIGIHALFGAFVAGVVMPPNLRTRNILIGKIEDLAIILFLPIFFVISGLRTEIGLIDTVYLWKITGWTILLAITGKLAGSALSLRYVGEKWRDSLIIGALMNTRGLMQLVVLGIGYELGVLSPEIFTIMIIMALVTTLMAGPALDLIDKILPDKSVQAEEAARGLYRILVSFGNPESGKLMLNLAYRFIKKDPLNASISVLHVTPGFDLHKLNLDEHENVSFQPVITEAAKLGISIRTIYKNSENVEKDIIETANSGDYDLLIAGKTRTLYEGSLIGRVLQVFARITNPGRLFETIRGNEKLFSKNAIEGPTRRLIKSINIPAAILACTRIDEIKSIGVVIYNSEETYVLSRAAELANNCDSRVLILDYYDQFDLHPGMNSFYTRMKSTWNLDCQIIPSQNINSVLKDKLDFLFLSIEGWHKFTQENRTHNNLPSVIIKP
ncbi:MAG: cation:proton antiporter [Bacteroidales bacterium]